MRSIEFNSKDNLVTIQKPSISNYTIKTYFDKLSSKILNLGLLPPVVRFISPLDSTNQFCVLVENRPRRQIIILDNTEYIQCGETLTHHNVSYDLQLPWHSYFLICQYYPKDDQISLVDIFLWFQPSQIITENDLSFSFLKENFLPNFYPGGKFCSGRATHNKYSTLDFISLYYYATDLIWNSSFNLDITPAEKYPILDFRSEDEQYTFEYNSSLLNYFSTLTIDQIVDILIPVNIASIYQVPIQNIFNKSVIKYLNFSLTLNDLFL